MDGVRSSGDALVVICAYAIVFAVALGLLAVALFLLDRESRFSRRVGAALVLMGLAIPLTCCVSPPYLFRLTYGTYPLGRFPGDIVKKGMTRDEVRALLGEPHEKSHDPDENWIYYLDSFGVGIEEVDFDANGRVSVSYNV